MALPKRVNLVEVGPREGCQFEGIGDPTRISTAAKVQLIDALAATGVGAIQMVSFVSPKQVPQMADAEAVCAAITPRAAVVYSGIYLNDAGLKRALQAGVIEISGKLSFTASDAFSMRNQRRTHAEDVVMQDKIAELYRGANIPITHGNIMAAFGCNFEGEIPLARVLDYIAELQAIAGGGLKSVSLADTMGWADPEMIRRAVGEVRSRWPDLRVALHLHDTRALAIANVYAALLEGVSDFDTAVGGLGGCPFAGIQGAAGNVCTEEVVFLCRQLGIETRIDLPAMVECARLAQDIVGHPLPSKLINANLDLPA